MTFREILHYGERVLLEAGIEDARADAWYLMENVFGISRSEYLLSMQEQAVPRRRTGHRCSTACTICGQTDTDTKSS